MKATRDFDEITVFGARGHSLMILRGLEEYWRGRVRIRALIDEIENGFTHPGLDLPVMSLAERRDAFPDLPVLLAVSNPGLRRRVATALHDQAATLATAVCPDQPHVDPAVDYGAGSICMPWTRIGPDSSIGPCAMVLATTIAHDVQIGAFSTLAFEVAVAGHVQIGQDVNMAPRAAIANGTRTRPIRIGDGAEIGSGAVVVGHVAPGARLIGNPAMPIRDWVRLRRLLRAGTGPEAR